MKILLQDYLQPCILEAKYTFYTNYYIPTDNQSEYISNLPINDPPGFFGLHSNAEIYSAILENKNLSSLVLGLLPRNTDISSP